MCYTLVAKHYVALFTEGARNIGDQQTNRPPSTRRPAVIEQVLERFLRKSNSHHMTIRSDSASAIARAGHVGAGPGQSRAINIRSLMHECRTRGKTADIAWVKGEGTPGNERADVLAGKSRRESRLLKSRVHGTPGASDLREVQEGEDSLA